MTWSDFFLICFLVGLALSAVSLLAGAFHLRLPGKLGHFHLPRIGHAHVPHIGHVGHVGHAHVPHVPHSPASANAGTGTAGPQISPLNFATLMAFVTWFGGVGYLMTSVYRLWFLAALVVATLAGFVGSSIVFWFFLKVLLAHDHTMNPADFEVVGVVGTITNTIREGGTGELVYSQGGTRKTTAARADSGQAIARGTEVAVTRFEKGIAYVRPWDELAGESSFTTGHATS
jgi:membrane protein implicated in regulation of membrane protease activity